MRVVAAIAGCETQSGTEQTLTGDEGAVDSEAVDITYLQSLLDKELGQPKFAVPKTVETSASPQGSPSAADAFIESAVGPERTSLHLTVTDGPAAGVTMQSANDQTEVRQINTQQCCQQCLLGWMLTPAPCPFRRLCRLS